MLCIYMPCALLYFLRNSLTNNVCTSNEDQMLNVLQTTQNTEQGRNRTPRTRKTLNTQQHQHVKQTRTCKRERPPRTIFTGTKINMRSAHRKLQRHRDIHVSKRTKTRQLPRSKKEKLRRRGKNTRQLQRGWTLCRAGVCAHDVCLTLCCIQSRERPSACRKHIDDADISGAPP